MKFKRIFTFYKKFDVAMEANNIEMHIHVMLFFENVCGKCI